MQPSLSVGDGWSPARLALVDLAAGFDEAEVRDLDAGAFGDHTEGRGQWRLWARLHADRLHVSLSSGCVTCAFLNRSAAGLMFLTRSAGSSFVPIAKIVLQSRAFCSMCIHCARTRLRGATLHRALDPISTRHLVSSLGCCLGVL